MTNNGFTALIVEYIVSRKQLKLEEQEKKTAKKLAGVGDPEQITIIIQADLEKRQEIEQKYTPRNWLTDAANRAGKISLVTHALKFTHSSAKGSSILSTSSADRASNVLSTATLSQPVFDAVCDAKALDVMGLLQLEYEGKSLLSCLNNDDSTSLVMLAENLQQLQQWMTGFKQILVNKNLSSHTLSKQLYFPIGQNEYHLLSPLFSSSLAHAMHQRIRDARFSDTSKEIDKAYTDGMWHPEARVIYRNTAVQKFGGSNQQNISSQNKKRGGYVWLLPCSAPEWQKQNKPPVELISIFQNRSAFTSMVKDTVWQLKQHLHIISRKGSTMERRQQQAAYVDEIIDILFFYVASIQNLKGFKGWSNDNNCKLIRVQQFWLDPWRSGIDADFKFEKENSHWQKEIIRNFGVWLNRQLEHGKWRLGEDERQLWSSLFKKRLREFELEFKGDFV